MAEEKIDITPSVPGYRFADLMQETAGEREFVASVAFQSVENYPDIMVWEGRVFTLYTQARRPVYMEAKKAARAYATEAEVLKLWAEIQHRKD